jgi:DNA polymerase-3 subunit epsilon
MRIPFAVCALDFETTGSVEGYAVEPWQLGMVRWDGVRVQCWETYLRVGERPFHPRAPGRHAQLRTELSTAPKLDTKLAELRALAGGVPLLAHNAATEQKCLREAVPMERFEPWIDTLKLSRAVWPGLASYALGDLLTFRNLNDRVTASAPGRGEHDALFDAWGSLWLLNDILALPDWQNVSRDVLLHPDQHAYYSRKR